MANLTLRSPEEQKRRSCNIAGFLVLLLVASPLGHTNPWAALWTTPCILAASVLIAWGAESAQFFVAQGFALAILAWMQTLPEFAVEAVLAWHRQTPLLMANLTGALRLLTGLAWPIVYCTAAFVYRRRTGRPLQKIELDLHHSVEIIALAPPLLYAFVIWSKASLHLYDAFVLIAFYAAYLLLLTRLPPQEKEGLEDLGAVPRSIVTAPRARRIAAIFACFFAGGLLIYFTAEPFLGSIIAVATALGVPTFIVIQWFAPVVSEFPELASTFYFARQPEKAAMAIMNIASSNINQWTLLMAMLPIVFSLSLGTVAGFPLDAEQRTEFLLTIAQSTAALALLLKMTIKWWEALTMFLLFAAQFALPTFFGAASRDGITAGFFAWTLGECIRLATQRQWPSALANFAETWRTEITHSRN